MGQLKELKLEIEDEISCLKLFKEIISNENSTNMRVEQTCETKGVVLVSYINIIRLCVKQTGHEREEEEEVEIRDHQTNQGNLQVELQSGGKQ